MKTFVCRICGFLCQSVNGWDTTCTHCEEGEDPFWRSRDNAR